MANKNIKKFYQNADKQYYYLPHALGHGAPTTVPEDSGLMYIDIDADNIYVSVAKSQVSDWKLLTGGSGGSVLFQTDDLDNTNQNLLNLKTVDSRVLINYDAFGATTFELTPESVKKIILVKTDETVSAQDYLSVGYTSFTSLDIPVTVGYGYSFRTFCTYDVNTTGYSILWAVSGGDPSPNYLGYSVRYPGSTVNQTLFSNSLTTFNATTDQTGSIVSTTGNMAIIEGLYYPSQNDTLRVSVAHEDGQAGAASVKLKAGSYVEYIEFQL